MTNISIHTTVDTHSEDYFTYFKDNYTKLCKHPERLKFYVHTLSGGLRYTKNDDNTTVVNAVLGKGSVGHSNGLDSAVRNFQDGEVNVVADVDTAFLVRDWDVVVHSLLETYGFVGSTYEKIGGFCTGDVMIQTYKDRPCMTWSAISVDASEVFKTSKTLNLQPFKQKNLKIDTQELSETFGLPVGYELLRDAAWQLPQFLRENKISFKTLFHARPTVEALVVRTGENYNEEYQLNGIPFVAHQRGSMKHPFRKPWSGVNTSGNFYDIVDKHVQSLLSNE